MKLTKNEKRILRILIANSRKSDVAIASELGITSQGVGKIRKRLEDKVIDSYTINLDHKKIGIKTFVISFSKLTKKGIEETEDKVEEIILANPHVIQFYKIPSIKTSYIIVYGFSDTEDMDKFFNTRNNKRETFKLIENVNTFTFSHNNYLKNNLFELIKEKIDDLN